MRELNQAKKQLKAQISQLEEQNQLAQTEAASMGYILASSNSILTTIADIKRQLQQKLQEEAITSSSSSAAATRISQFHLEADSSIHPSTNSCRWIPNIVSVRWH